MRPNLHAFQILSGSSLKIIAILSMVIDHFAASILYNGFLLPAAPISQGSPYWNLYLVYRAMRTIGRIAFPIFCFLLVEGFFYTSNRKKYALRMLVFALFSEFPFDFALFQTPITWNYQNVFFTLLIGFLTIWAMEQVKTSAYALPKQLLCVLAGCVVAYALKTDYDYYGVTLIAVLYFLRYNRLYQTIGGILSLLWEAPACLAFIPINMYNGKRGFSMKYFFYAFYPLHLLIFGIILHLI